ncbi:hypothetical protein [Salibacterium halotolerans]|uniref:Uncharacterized protein n=1 Tax=Salibacterium halotolerans TaxID=1884432 RepID=A0A1I5L9G3_9BACI|nr:hypothetical protein [Salibacterium halotolerans]SFO93858.1 hypothetical protein SAMN05518683_101155 [Salibacterium halotolerans]
MSLEEKQKLRGIVQHAIDNQQFDRAEQAVHHLRQLSALESFIQEAPASENNSRSNEKREENTGAVESTEEKKIPEKSAGEGITIYYIQDENLIKFRKSPQTYSVDMEFLKVFLDKLEEWREREPFSSKDFFDQYAETLKAYATYQTSTLRQFVTLLFRAAFHLGILEKPASSQRSRYITSSTVGRDDIIERVVNEKTIEL